MNNTAYLEEVKRNAGKLISQFKPSITITHICQVKDLRFTDKIYDVFVIDTLQDGKYIMKLDSSGYESRVYLEILQQFDFATPGFLGGMQDCQNRYWFLSYYASDQDMVTSDLAKFCAVAKQLAKIHSSFFNFKSGKLGFLKDKSERISSQLVFLENCFNDGTVQISHKMLSVIKFVVKRLNARPQTFIHNDLLPINILAGQCGVYFIDWANAAFGCYAHDLGRLLGDFQNESGESWVRPDWHQSILRAYYETVCMPEDANWTWTEFMVDFTCSCLWNHAEIVIAHLQNGWNLSPWYEANFKSMLNYGNMLVNDMCISVQLY